MTLGSALAHALGPQQPIYAIHAEGIDGRTAPVDNMRDVISAYIRQIREIGITGLIRIGGMCGGCTAAIEVARDLQKAGTETGPVILVDPPPPAPQFQKRSAGPLQPEAAEQLYQWVRTLFLDLARNPGNDFPFDVNDADQLHVAAVAGRSAAIAHDRFVNIPFPGPTEIILGQSRAASFFHPQLPWRKLFPGPCMAYVLPLDHNDLVNRCREPAIRLLKFIVEEGLIVDNAPSD